MAYESNTPMTDKLIKAAVEEAERFLRATRKMGTDEVEVGDGKDADGRWKFKKIKGTGPRTRAAIRRASMDLTNALADMRIGREK